QGSARQKIGFIAGLCEFVPRADRQAIVAPEDAVADRRPQLIGDRALVLDRQIRDAAPRIEPVGSREGGGRAGVEAAATLAAMVGFRRVGIEREAEINLTEKQPGAEFAVHPIGLLALPAETGLLRQPLFHA